MNPFEIISKIKLYFQLSNLELLDTSKMFDEPTTPKECHCLVFVFLDFDNVLGFLLTLIKRNYHV